MLQSVATGHDSVFRRMHLTNPVRHIRRHMKTVSNHAVLITAREIREAIYVTANNTGVTDCISLSDGSLLNLILPTQLDTSNRGKPNNQQQSGNYWH